MDKELGKCMLIELSPHLWVFKLHIYPKESRDLTPYSESPVQVLQELNKVSRPETKPPKGPLVPRRRPTVAEIMTVVCWSVYCCCCNVRHPGSEDQPLGLVVVKFLNH
jgi:hypothetical protein